MNTRPFVSNLLDSTQATLLEKQFIDAYQARFGTPP
jgi:hypothetical protein